MANKYTLIVSCFITISTCLVQATDLLAFVQAIDKAQYRLSPASGSSLQEPLVAGRSEGEWLLRLLQLDEKGTFENLRKSLCHCVFCPISYTHAALKGKDCMRATRLHYTIAIPGEERRARIRLIIPKEGSRSKRKAFAKKYYSFCYKGTAITICLDAIGLAFQAAPCLTITRKACHVN